MEIQRRMSAIMSEFALLPQMERFDLTLESLVGGAIKASVIDKSRPYDSAERIILPTEDLSFIGHTFNYPNTFTPTSKLFNDAELKELYFDPWGYLIVVHDNSTEIFKVDPKQKNDIMDKLKSIYGDKFNHTSTKPIEHPKKKQQPKAITFIYKINFTLNGKDDYFVVEASTLEGARKLANELVKERNLDPEENDVWSEKLN